MFNGLSYARFEQLQGSGTSIEPGLCADRQYGIGAVVPEIAGFYVGESVLRGDLEKDIHN